MKSIVFYTYAGTKFNHPHYHQFHHLHSPPDILESHNTGATGFTGIGITGPPGYRYTGIGITGTGATVLPESE